MIGIQSLCTQTGRFTPNRGTLLMHTLSQACLNRSFEVTEFVGDDRALEIADSLGWEYSNYALHQFNPEIRWIWATNKIEAFQLQEVPFCHVDNDAIATRPLEARVTQARMHVQYKDDPDFYRSDEMDIALDACQAERGCVAYNMGFFGGNDLDSIHRYCGMAIDRAYKFNGKPVNSITASMVTEQHCLGEFVRKHHIKVEPILPMLWTDSDIQRTGIAHFFGGSYLEREWAKRIETKLETEFPSAYDKFLSGWDKIT